MITTRTFKSTHTISEETLERLIQVGNKALEGDSNDAEHDALYDIVTELECVQGQTGEVATSPVTQVKWGSFSYSIRNHLGHEVGTVETQGDAIAAYACKVNANSSELRAAGYKAVPMHGVEEAGKCPDCGGTGYEEIDHGHYPCPRGCLPETGEVKTPGSQ